MFVKGKPGVYLKSGDVYTAGGESFAVDSFKEMAGQILKYKEDKDYYNNISGLARKRAKLMTSSEEAIAGIDRFVKGLKVNTGKYNIVLLLSDL